MRYLSPLSKRLTLNFCDVVFPPRCAGCGRRGSWVCNSCVGELKPIEPPHCSRCGSPVGERCICHHLSLALDSLRSAAWYDGWLRTAIQTFKYQGEYARDGHLASLLLPLVAEFSSDICLAPVPLHPVRERQRGYNQAGRLAARLSSGTGLTVVPALHRTMKTLQQVGLPASARTTNVRGAFTAERAVVDGRRVLLVDDVVTTGSTLGSCAEALKAGGASWVGAITVARER